MRKLFIYGFPSLYGGAGTELHHQIYAWKALGNIEIHIIPTCPGYKNEPLYQEMLDIGVKIHEPHKFSVVSPDDAVISFCGSLFLENVRHINQFTKRTVFVNCMTWLFNDEKKSHEQGLIAHSLYQRPQIRDEHEQQLRLLGSRATFTHFIPYFHGININFGTKDDESVHIGRISRVDKDKFTRFNSQIYAGIISPKPKVGHFLGWGPKAHEVTGTLPTWIKTYPNHNTLPVSKFYDTVDFIVQPTNTTENWPRIGLEAMHAGVPLVVDNRGGWQYMIEHGVTGFLCNNERDFMYYGSRLAYDLDLRNQIAYNARKKAEEISGLEISKESWRQVFEVIFN